VPALTELYQLVLHAAVQVPDLLESVVYILFKRAPARFREQILDIASLLAAPVSFSRRFYDSEEGTLPYRFVLSAASKWVHLIKQRACYRAVKGWRNDCCITVQGLARHSEHFACPPNFSLET
jgi:hypothetical protein